jgi:hypothetical protein
MIRRMIQNMYNNISNQKNKIKHKTRKDHKRNEIKIRQNKNEMNEMK